MNHWSMVGNDRKRWSWGSVVRLSKVEDRVPLGIEAQNAMNDVLFKRKGASLARAEELRALSSTAVEELDACVLGKAPWPGWLGLVQLGGLRKLDPLVEFSPACRLVDGRFVAPLRQAGLTTGWDVVDVPLRDRDWKTVSTHSLLVVTGRVQCVSVPDDVPSRPRYPPLAVMRQQPAPVPAIAMAEYPGQQTTFQLLANSEAGSVLAAAKLPGLRLDPAPWASDE